MRSVNKVILIGNLTRDPELRQTANGQTITTFGLATNREWVTAGEEKKSSAEFHECVAWAKLAEICAKYLKKSKFVYVEGYLKTRSWDTEEGIRKFKTEIVVEDMIMLDKRSSDDEYIPTADEEIPVETKVEESAITEEQTTTEEPEVTPEEPIAVEKDPADNPIDKDLGI